MMLFEKYTINEHEIIIKTEHSFVFVNYKPFSQNHLLISPINVKERLSELTDEERKDLFKTVRLTVKALKERHNNFTISIQDGEYAGQSVKHVHVHVVPIKDAVFDKERTQRTEEDMKKEADDLRPLFIKAMEC